jgi:hypothetical protein
MATPTSPIDQAHEIALYLTKQIRRQVREVQKYIDTWEPAPLDPDWVDDGASLTVPWM